MLIHSCVKRNIIVLAPSSKRVQKKDWVLESSLDQLFSSVFKKENVSIMEWVSNLEGIDGISVSLLGFSIDFSWGKSILVNSIIEFNSLYKSH